MEKSRVLEELRSRALKALDRPSPYGVDIDVRQFIELESNRELSVFSYREKVSQVGIDLSAKTRSGFYYQVDNKIELFKSLVSGVEIIPLEQAIEERWDEIKEYLWRLIPVDLDKYTAITFLRGFGGHYIRVKKNTRVELPIQACFLMSGGAQLVHNIIVLEEGSEASMITGCTIAPEAMSLHVGVTEIYLEPRAKLIDIMIHSWSRVTHVRPRTAVLLKDEAIYASYYINMSTTKSLQSFPRVEVVGRNARVYSATVVLGLAESIHDIGAYAILKGEESSAELVSKLIAKDRSRITTRLRIEGLGSRTRGYIECSGLLLSREASIESVPELAAYVEDSDLFHEASIGKLRDDEVEYLLLKGFSYREAISILIRGFVDIEMKYLTPEVEKSLKSVLDTLARRST